MNEFLKNQKRLAESLVNGMSEFDDRPRDPMPTDAEIDAMHEMFVAEKGQTASEAFRLAH